MRNIAKLTSVFGCLLFAVLCRGQYTNTVTKGITDITSRTTSSTNAWFQIGNITCIPFTVSIGEDGTLMCINFDHYIYSFNASNHTWVKQTAMGTAGVWMAVQDSDNVWQLQSTSACTAIHAFGIFVWNGTAWDQPDPAACLIELYVSPVDGTLTGADYNGAAWKSSNAGVSWIRIGTLTGWTQLVAADANNLCGVKSGVLYTASNGSTMTAFSPAPPGTIAGCAWGADAQSPSFLVWEANTGVVHDYNFISHAWATVTGPVDYLVSISKGRTIGQGFNYAIFHYNVFPLYDQEVTTGQYTGCPINTCPGGAQHRVTMGPFTAPHSLLISTSGNVTGAATSFFNVSAFGVPDPTLCDPFFGDPTAPDCSLTSSGEALCLVSGATLLSAFPSLACFTNIVPGNAIANATHPLSKHVYPQAWASNGSVTVYINTGDYPSGSTGYTGICNGIKSWVPGNGISYTCTSSNGVPSPEPTQRYIYVSKGGNRGSTDACGPSLYKNCPKPGHNLFRAWMQIDNRASTLQQFEGEAAHEEGHNNGLWDCTATCSDGGSVMGSQSTMASNQPDAPTACDLFWYGINRVLF